MMSMRSLAAGVVVVRTIRFAVAGGPEGPHYIRMRLILYLEYQAILGQLDAPRQAGTSGRVPKFVADVREVGTLRTDARGGIHGFGHAEVSRVRPVAQRIQHQCPHSFEQRP